MMIRLVPVAVFVHLAAVAHGIWWAGGSDRFLDVAALWAAAKAATCRATPVRQSTTVPNVSKRTARTSHPVDGERYGWNLMSCLLPCP